MEKKITVITRGATGMGYAVAEELGKEGPVIIGGRREGKLVEAVEKLEAQGIEAYWHLLDISDVESVREFAEAANAIYPIGNVVTVAGIYVGQADNAGIIRVNALGTVNVNEVFLPYMKEGSVMVNFASNSGHLCMETPELAAVWKEPNAADFVERFAALAGEDQFGVYSLTKRFVIKHTAANAMRFGQKGVRIFSISPGAFETQMLANADVKSIESTTPLGRVGDPKEMGIATRLLVDPRNTFMSGCDVLIDGGLAGFVSSLG